MSQSRKLSPETCPGIKSYTRPTISYVKCDICGGQVELWSDEDNGVCLNCGVEWHRPSKGASCLEYCEFADKCKEIIKSRNKE